MEPTPADRELTSWLAEHTHTDAGRIEAELEVGERRRAFVVAELVDAGFEGAELLELAIQLTGLERGQVRALLTAHAAREAGEPDIDTTPRRDRALAENEILFRRLNERLASGAAAGGPAAGALTLLCECSDRECVKVFAIAAAEYDWLRQDARRFVVLPGHEAPALEHEQVKAADPRA
ncbi:MAG: hypothetical protein H0V94_08600 [Actinobacteria bacterium]|nr:hypothetical protein [Actinomycetota bacterium]